MDGVILKLTEPVTTHEETFTEIALREPRGELFARLGPPRIPVINQTAGSGYWVERDDVIKEYLKALIDVGQTEFLLPYAEGILKHLSLTDSLRLRDALFGFFLAAEAKAAAMRSATSSSVSSS